MEDIRIFCENDRDYKKVPPGITLKELSETLDGNADFLAALVDNKLKGLDYRIMQQHNIRFIGYEHPDGRRTYIRSLCFVLQNAVSELFPGKILAIDYSLPSGLYCEIREAAPLEDGRPDVYFATDEEI